MGRALQNLLGQTQPQSMYRGVWGDGFSKKGKNPANSYTVACQLKIDILLLSQRPSLSYSKRKWQFAALGFFFQQSLRRGFIFQQMRGRSWVIFSGEIHLQVGRAPHWGCFCFDEGCRQHPNHASSHQGKPRLVLKQG